MASRDGQSDDSTPVFQVDEEQVVDLAGLLEDDSASTGPSSSPKAGKSPASSQVASLRQSAIEAAAQSLASSLEEDTGGAGGFDDAVSALIYGDSPVKAPAPVPQAPAPAPKATAQAHTTPAAAPPKTAPPTLKAAPETVDSTASNVFKVDLDGLDDFEALLQRTMGEAAGLTPAPKAAPSRPPVGKTPPEKATAQAKPMMAPQWRKPDMARPPERQRTDGPSQESKAVDELRKKVKAMTTETDAYRRRLEDSAKAARGKGREDVFKALLPIMDALEMAIKSTEGTSGQGDQVTKGIELLHKQLRTDLGLLGLQLITPLGDVFDPNVHEALQQVTTGKVTPGQVAEVVRNGYRFEDRLLRAAQVLVEKA
jgi:molecular chaperone GrpE